MIIKELRIENYKGIKHLHLEFPRNGAVIYGVNGVGKTTIISALNMLISRVLDRALQGRIINQVSFSETDARAGSLMTEIEICLVMENHEFRISRGYSKKKGSLPVNQKPLNDISTRLRSIIEDESNSGELPIFVMYGVNRAVIDIPLRIRSKHSFERKYAFEKSSIGTDFRTFFEWYRNQEDYENQVRANGNPDFRDSQLAAVRNAIYALLPGFSGLMVDRKPKLRMVVNKDKTKLAIDQLSDGEKCCIAMMGDLARRMAIANPDKSDSLDSSGIVLIDEIELHLHPEWQRSIVPSLRGVFPNVQFIITTHSPQVLGEVRDMQIVKLVSDGADISAQLNNLAYGRDSAFILEEYMDTRGRNADVINKISKMYRLINSRDYGGAENIARELTFEVGNDDADVVKARALISRGRYRYESNQ
jgi:predicted ATP-binding protein involved in virulence